MRTYIFRYIGTSTKETVHAKDRGDAYNKLYERGIPFYVVELIREV